MAIRFKKSVKTIKYLNPFQGFNESQLNFEIRIDPLTGRRTRIMNHKFRLLHPPDLDEIVARSLERPCPFCAENLEHMTPRFPIQFVPEGRIRVGEAVVFPNFMPYDQNNGVASFSKDHFVGLTHFTEELLANAFQAAQIFLKRVRKAHPKTHFFSINWNYMPPSGASLIHPHLHILADKDPSDHHRLILKRGKRFWKKFQVNYWEDLIREEKRLQERFLGETGKVSWLLDFAPRGMMFDVLGVFAEKHSILELSSADFRDFARGLQRVFQYLDRCNLFSFNLALFSGLSQKDCFRCHARLVPRFTIPPMGTSDVNFIGLNHDESLAVIGPEDVCLEMRPYF